MGKQAKKIIFREPETPFIITPNVKEQQIRKALEVLTEDLSRRMSITRTEAALVVKFSDARRIFRKKIPEYLSCEV